MKCLIIDSVHSSIKEELSACMQVDECMRPSKELLSDIIEDYDVLIMRVDPVIDNDVLEKAKKLKVIGVCSVGLDHIDLSFAEKKNIYVCNAPGLNTNAVAELTICKMLEISRHTVPACRDVKENNTWNKYKFPGRELKGRTLGILGFGRIGQRVGEIARVFGMNIVAYDPYLPKKIFKEQNAESLSIKEVLKVSDFVSIHMPLNDETKNLFNKDSINSMKKDAVVINMARGGIVNERDMCDALKSGRLAGYAADVMEHEVSGAVGITSPLFECDNFIVTPHIGAQTEDASEAIARHIISKVKEHLCLS